MKLPLALAFVLLAGCQEKIVIEVKGDPERAALMEAGLDDLKGVGKIITQANDEDERLSKEVDAQTKSGASSQEIKAMLNYWAIRNERKRRAESTNELDAAKWFVDQVRGKALAELPVQPPDAP